MGEPYRYPTVCGECSSRICWNTMDPVQWHGEWFCGMECLEDYEAVQNPVGGLAPVEPPKGDSVNP